MRGTASTSPCVSRPVNGSHSATSAPTLSVPVQLSVQPTGTIWTATRQIGARRRGLLLPATEQQRWSQRRASHRSPRGSARRRVFRRLRGSTRPVRRLPKASIDRAAREAADPRVGQPSAIGRSNRGLDAKAHRSTSPASSSPEFRFCRFLLANPTGSSIGQRAPCCRLETIPQPMLTFRQVVDP
jgi:hypothetical protein